MQIQQCNDEEMLAIHFKLLNYGMDLKTCKNLIDFQ